MLVVGGSTDVTVPFYFVDDVGGSAPGEPTTGLLFSDIETGGSASYQRQGGARVDFELFTLANASVAHSDGGFILIDDTEMAGAYRCDAPDAAFADGVDFVIIYLRAAAGKNTITRPIKIDLITVNLRDGVRAGLTSLPTPIPGAAGGLFIAGTNAATVITGSLTTTFTGALTGGVLSVTNAIVLPATAPAGFITAASIAASALDGKGNWNIGKTGYSITTLPAIPSNWLTAAGIATGALNGKGDWPVGKTGYALSATGADLILQASIFSVDLAKAVWDRVLTGATHNINNSAGKRLRSLGGVIMQDGTASAGTASTLIDVVLFDNQFLGSRILLIAGTGSVHEALIVGSEASSNTFTFDPPANAAVSANTEYEIIPAHVFAQTINQGYTEGAVIIDTNNGIAGDIVRVNGTEESPSSNITDATTIAGAILPVPSKHFTQRKGSSIQLGQTYFAWLFNGRGGTVDLNGQDVSLCTFVSQLLTGAGIGASRVFVRDCLLSNLSINDGAFIDCSLTGTFTVTDIGPYSFDMCIPQDTSSPPTIDFGAAVASTNVELLNWAGPIIISNLGASGTDTLYVTGHGEITLDATCVGGTLIYAGDFTLTNDGTTSAITRIGSQTDTFKLAALQELVLTDTAQSAAAAGSVALLAQAAGGGGGTVGPGGTAFPVTCQAAGVGIPGVKCWITNTSDPLTGVIAGVLITNDEGNIELNGVEEDFMLDTGVPYWLWRNSGTHDFPNPQTFTL